MTTSMRIVLACCLSGVLATAQSHATAKKAFPPAKAAQEATRQPDAGPGGLNTVLDEMDRTASKLNVLLADVDLEHRNGTKEKVQHGSIEFRRTKSGIAASVKTGTTDTKKTALRDVDFRFYQTQIGPPKEQREAATSVVIALGFGTRGDELAKNFNVKLNGWETIDGYKTAMLELTPRENTKSLFTRALLWVEPSRNITLKQSFFHGPAESRLIRYRNIQLNPSEAPPQAKDDALAAVLSQMNKAAANFKSAQADFEWDQFTRVVEEHDIQKGQIYFERNKHGIDAAVKVVSPEPKQVVFKDGQLSLYQPKIDQVTEYKSGSNRQDVESYMSLGFGASGDDLARNFEVKLDGWEPVDGVRTARLELVPKNQKMKASISRILLWMDPNRNVSLKQQFFEPSGDYRLTHYTNIKLNSHFSDDVFRLRTTSKTKVVQPQ